jgi:hypothetical protein
MKQNSLILEHSCRLLVSNWVIAPSYQIQIETKFFLPDRTPIKILLHENQKERFLTDQGQCWNWLTQLKQDPSYTELMIRHFNRILGNHTDSSLQQNLRTREVSLRTSVEVPLFRSLGELAWLCHQIFSLIYQLE